MVASEGYKEMVRLCQEARDERDDYLDLILRVMIPHIKNDGTLQHVGFILDQWQRIHDGKHKEMKAWLESKE